MTTKAQKESPEGRPLTASRLKATANTILSQIPISDERNIGNTHFIAACILNVGASIVQAINDLEMTIMGNKPS